MSGGTARVAGNSSTDTQLQLMLSQIGDSIKQVASNQNNSGNQMLPMMMMMMMGGGGGGGGGAAAAAPPAAPAPAPQPSTYVKVNLR
ncbi:MAG: hypothetical protein ACM31C_15670 [Acidobacteriota bacterium]